MTISLRFVKTLEAKTVKPNCPLRRTNTPSKAVFAPKGPFVNTKALGFSTQAYTGASARFDPVPMMRNIPESKKQNEGTNGSIGNSNMFDFQDEARFFEMLARW